MITIRNDKSMLCLATIEQSIPEQKAVPKASTVAASIDGVLNQYAACSTDTSGLSIGLAHLYMGG